MLARSLIRAAQPAMRRQSRTYASEANKATSSPQGTHGGTVPSRGEPAGKTKYSYGGYIAGAVVVGGAGCYLLAPKGQV